VHIGISFSRGDVFGFDIDDSSRRMALQASRCLPANWSSANLSAKTTQKGQLKAHLARAGKAFAAPALAFA